MVSLGPDLQIAVKYARLPFSISLPIYGLTLMPGPLIPKKSGVHRAACFALYRALLRQTSSLLIPDQCRSQYREQVKTKTRENARLQGHWNITIALRLGYETLDAIEDEIRRPAVLDRVAELAAPPPQHFQRVNEKAQSEGTKGTKPERRPLQQGRPPHHSPVLERPYPIVSGRRHVPKLMNANRIPILCIKKPQSPLLGALIRSIIRTREKRLLRTRQMAKLTGSGEDEDEWDRILREEFDLQEQGGSWTEESVKYHERIRLLHFTFLERRKRLSRQMTRIVEREEVLARGERSTWRRRAYVQQRVQLLLRHGRDQEAKALADKAGVRLEDLTAPTARNGTKKTVTSALESQVPITMPSEDDKPVSNVFRYSISPEARKPRIALNKSTVKKGNDARKAEAVQPQKGVLWKPQFAVATPLNQPGAEGEQKRVTRRKVETWSSKEQASSRRNQVREPGRTRYRYDHKALPKPEAEKNAVTELGSRSPKRTLGGVSMAEAMGGEGE